MARPRSLKPAYCLHKPSGRAFVKLDGRRTYLGRHGTRESRDAYDRAIGEWIACGRQSPPPPAVHGQPTGGITVTELVAGFWQHAQTYYVTPDGKPASEQEIYRLALRPLRRLYGPTPAAAFGPLAMRALMREMAGLGWGRKSVNRQASRIKSVFKWAVANELISASVYQGLATVGGYRKGKSPARETAPVRPVPDEQIDAVLPLVSRQVAAMIRLQLVTGMRPGEVCQMTTGDIDRTGPVWTYTPRQHKTAHLDIDRVIDLGPRCQDFLAPFLKPLNPTAYLFSPAESEAERLAALHERRILNGTPLSCGNRPGTNRQRRPKRTAGPRFTVSAYRRAIARACDKAFPPPAPLAKLDTETGKAWRARLTAEQRAELSAWRVVNRWRPHRLRHNAATRLRREFGIDVARIILGHKSDSTTSIYAERDRAKARDVMGKVG